MSVAPLIGIACDLDVHAEYPVRDRHALRPTYTRAVRDAGGLPLIIPASNDRAQLAEVIERLDGLLLPGGDDIPPKYYGQEPHPSLSLMPDLQYETWAGLVELTLAADKPLLAICAGIQVLNVALGGTLIQDIPSQHPSPVTHRTGAPQVASHLVEVMPESQLARLLGVTRTRVNSAHHQGLDRLAAGLEVVARCPDDELIEGVVLPGKRFCVGVQWHPERYFNETVDRRLFAAFVAAAQRMAKSE
jgi:putative glutamine amidotransferase